MLLRPNRRQIAVLLLVSAGAILVHGYHPYVEDAEIYVPGIKQILNPSLYPRNPEFFSSHAGFTLFPNLIASSVRLPHLPVDWALLLWQFFCIFLLLAACWRLGQICFADPRARWGSVLLVASLLTIPVAGTALYLMDQYMNPRSLSTPAVLFLVINTIERRLVRAALWTILIAVIHPLMAVFGVFYAVLLLWMQSGGRERLQKSASTFTWLPFGLFPSVTSTYREVLESHGYFSLRHWHWYEWLGIFAPMMLLWWFHGIARKQNLPALALLCRALLAFGSFFFAFALVISIPPSLASFAELQPMRSLHLLYLLFFVFAGGLLVQWVLQDRLWRWLLLFIPLSGGMWFAQRQLFSATPHWEWPGNLPQNEWVEAFLWVRQSTPLDAYFALNPEYMSLAGEDQHGFRAIAERSRLADNIKDSGAVTMFPALAENWRRQVLAQSRWKEFQLQDFRRLKDDFGVTWVVLEQPGVPGMACPHQNNRVLVCRIE